MSTMGAAYQSLGLYPASETLLRKSLDVRRNMSGVDPMAVAESLHDLGQVLVLRGDFTGAEPILSEALTLRERPGAASNAVIAETLGSLGILAHPGVNMRRPNRSTGAGSRQHDWRRQGTRKRSPTR